MSAHGVGAITRVVIPGKVEGPRGLSLDIPRDPSTSLGMTVIFLPPRNDRRRLQLVGMFRELFAKHPRQLSVMQNIHVCVVLPDVVVLPRFIPPTKADHGWPASG